MHVLSTNGNYVCDAWAKLGVSKRFQLAIYIELRREVLVFLGVHVYIYIHT